MDLSEKRTLTSINKIPFFRDAIQGLTTGRQLSENEKSYLLACAILFLRHYGQDKRRRTYCDFAYYIILKYSVTYSDYRPLYDFATVFGFYPIVSFILDRKMLPDESISHQLVSLEIERYRSEGYIETIHQFNEKKSLLSDSSNSLSYVAPTSFGKSSVIVDCIKAATSKDQKIAIIVPTKSLLMQTYRMIRDKGFGKKLIIHDEMYQGEPAFIAIFTQERALRLLEKNEIHFDLIFIDEAHNILKDDSRSILLSRLLNRNYRLNKGHRVVYLSPLIEDIENLKMYSDHLISQHKIHFNIKEPEIFEVKLNNSVHKYNRFVNEHYHIGQADGLFSYILKTAGEKNFIYNYRPIYIERLAKDLAQAIPDKIVSERLQDLINNLRQEVHERFYAVQYVAKGIIYLHGKLPDLIKEYLESKFRDIPEIKYVVANSVILEGMNLPIDTLYVLNTYSLQGKELTNLIGRVNRLNNIFSNENKTLEKLLPKVHFLNNEDYNRKGSSMTSKIEMLRSRTFPDTIENPILESFDFTKLKINADQKDRAKKKYEQIKRDEEFLSKDPQTHLEKLKQNLIESGISNFYSNVDRLSDLIALRLDGLVKTATWGAYDVIEKIWALFVNDIDYIMDKEFARLRYSEARAYYKNHILISQRRALKQNINYTVGYFKSRIADNNGLTFFGTTYGEQSIDPLDEAATSQLYIDLTSKTETELVNLAIVKLKIEDDFVSFKVNKFIVMLYDYDLISTNDYNEYVYGTTDQHKIELTKIGLNIGLINKLEADGQLKNIFLDEYNNLAANAEFMDYKSSANDFYRFELERFLG
ncbi:DEAD/DEAH box helicase [Chryseosolibacter indicus]|uniref:DEAD/DEAH box helicase n=1 Tax=Chryseosolibacter indicus TaxID=2782351 RepID=A0ABS5VVC7_9BACT|nr:DEAD/DEAH box helicase [Chryseosolibacter indicus]MBT1705291.1 DEAD/DEAH box helicase [Chryseosolibacter indicus]